MNASNGNRNFTDDLARVISPWEPEQPAIFGPGEVVTATYITLVDLRGKRIWVPSNTAAVITSCDGNSHLRGAGEAFFNGVIQTVYYEYRYVDLSIKKIDRLRVQAKSKDGWEVTLMMTVNWRVVDPLKVVMLPKAGETVAKAVEAAANDLIRHIDHDLLAQVVGSNVTPILSRNIAQPIWHDVQSAINRYGIEVQDVQVLERLPDPRREEIIKQAYVERTQMDLEKGLIQQRAEVKKSSLEQDKKLLVMESEIAVEKAAMNRKAIEEEEMVREKKARIANDEAKILYESQMLQAEIQKMMQRPGFEHEEILKQIEVNGNLVSRFIEALSMNQRAGLAHPIDQDVIVLILKLISDIARMPRAGLPALASETRPIPRVPARQSLAEALYTLEGEQDVCCEDIISEPDGTAKAVIRVKNLTFTLVCNDDFPQSGPCQTLVQLNGSDPVVMDSTLVWTPGMHMRQYLRAAFELAKPMWNPTIARNNGHNVPPEKSITK